MDITSELRKRFTGNKEGEDANGGDGLFDGEADEVAQTEEAEGGRKRSTSKRKKKKKRTKTKDSEQPTQPGQRQTCGGS